MDFSLKHALEVLIAMLVVALVFMVTAYLLKNNGNKSTSTNSEAWKGVNAVEKKSKDINTKDRFMAPVTYEDWVIDKDGNRRVKLGSKTVNKRIGEYAHGSDIGGNTAMDAERIGYYYIKETSVKVSKTNNVVYRYFYYRVDMNETIYMKDGTKKDNYWGVYDTSKGFGTYGSTKLLQANIYINNVKIASGTDYNYAAPYGTTVKYEITYLAPAVTAKEMNQTFVANHYMLGDANAIQLYEK